MIDHFGFQCTDMAVAAHFYNTVLATLGGRRIMDFPGCYGAFVRDPDGNNVEVVCHDAGGPA